MSGHLWPHLSCHATHSNEKLCVTTQIAAAEGDADLLIFLNVCHSVATCPNTLKAGEAAGTKASFHLVYLVFLI